MHPDLIIAIFATVWGVGSLVLSAYIVRALVRTNWNDPLKPFQPREPAAEDAPVDARRYQSFGVGLLNLGWSVHVAADRRYLHLTPAWPGKVLGLRAASVPWAEIGRGAPGGLRVGSFAGLKIGSTVFAAPAWLERHRQDLEALGSP